MFNLLNSHEIFPLQVSRRMASPDVSGQMNAPGMIKQRGEDSKTIGLIRLDRNALNSGCNAGFAAFVITHHSFNLLL